MTHIRTCLNTTYNFYNNTKQKTISTMPNASKIKSYILIKLQRFNDILLPFWKKNIEIITEIPQNKFLYPRANYQSVLGEYMQCQDTNQLSSF